MICTVRVCVFTTKRQKLILRFTVALFAKRSEPPNSMVARLRILQQAKGEMEVSGDAHQTGGRR
jgi:hypothetical protein